MVGFQRLAPADASGDDGAWEFAAFAELLEIPIKRRAGDFRQRAIRGPAGAERGAEFAVATGVDGFAVGMDGVPGLMVVGDLLVESIEEQLAGAIWYARKM